MPHPGQTRFDIADTVTVYVLAVDGALIDVIENVDLDDPIEARRDGRTPLKEAALWGAIAVARYEEAKAERITAPAASERD
jgi:hypothetical protein